MEVNKRPPSPAPASAARAPVPERAAIGVSDERRPSLPGRRIGLPGEAANTLAARPVRPEVDGPSMPPLKRPRLDSDSPAQSTQVSLPADGAVSILGFVAAESAAHDTMEMLDTLSLVSTGMRTALTQDPHLRRKFSLLREVSQAASDLLATPPGGFQRWHADLTPLLGPDQRARLVAGAIGSNMMGTLGAQLQHLSPTQRSQLVERALALPADGRSWQVQGLIKGLAHLTPELGDAVIDEVMASPPLDLVTKTRLASAVEHLTPGQRQRVAQALEALPCPDSKAEYMIGLAPGLAHLEPGQRQHVADIALGLSQRVSFQRRGGLLQALAAQAGHLDPSQRSAIATAVLSERSVGARVQALVGLARGAGALTDAERERLVATSLALPQDWRQRAVLKACGEHAGHFSSEQRSRLVAAVPGLVDWFRSDVIAAFGKSRAHLTARDQASLLDAARAIGDPGTQSLALAGFGAGHEALTLLRTRVIPPGVAPVSVAPQFTIEQLCKDMHALTDADRQHLLDLIAQLDWNSRARLTGDVCARMPLLDQTQQDAVKDMVLGLPDFPFKARLLATLGDGINAIGPEPAAH